jgi:hypothetical protein
MLIVIGGGFGGGGGGGGYSGGGGGYGGGGQQGGYGGGGYGGQQGGYGGGGYEQRKHAMAFVSPMWADEGVQRAREATVGSRVATAVVVTAEAATELFAILCSVLDHQVRTIARVASYSRPLTLPPRHGLFVRVPRALFGGCYAGCLMIQVCCFRCPVPPPFVWCVRPKIPLLHMYKYPDAMLILCPR